MEYNGWKIDEQVLDEVIRAAKRNNNNLTIIGGVIRFLSPKYLEGRLVNTGEPKNSIK